MADRPRVVAIVQARMGSTRLPGKVLMDVAGMSVLGRCLSRLGRARELDAIAVATTVEPRDEAVVEEAHRCGALVCRGSERDVLGRYARAAEEHAAEIVVRITSDCPLVEPDVVDAVVRRMLAADRPDFASTLQELTLPNGLDAEAFTLAALRRADAEARLDYQREHVDPYFMLPEVFRLASIAWRPPLPRYKLSVDTADDLARICALVEAAVLVDPALSLTTLVTVLRQRPELAVLEDRQ